MLDVEHRPGEVYLARIEIDPIYQGYGTGTRLISDVRVTGLQIVSWQYTATGMMPIGLASFR